MCNSTADGGKRCIPGTTAAHRRNLVRQMNRAEGTAKRNELQNKIINLDNAKKKYGNCVSPMDLNIPDGVQNVLNTISSKGYNPILVGGTVRDALLGDGKPKDFDIEVYGTDIDTLAKSLRRSGYRVDEVGKRFGVLKVTTKDANRDDLDISVPRRDSLVGAGHRGFDIEMDPEMSVAEASARRDYTINTLGWDYRYGVMIDPHNGAEDLRHKNLRHVSEAFAEDPLRTIRGFQFAARFGMTMDPETAEFARSLYPRAKELPKEGFATEWEKFYHKAKYPSAGMKVMRDIGWNNHAPGLAGVNNEEMDHKLDTVHEVSTRDGLNNTQKATLYAATLMRNMSDEDADGFARTTLIGKEKQQMAKHMRSTRPTAGISNYGVRRLAQELGRKKITVEDWARYERISGDKGLADEVLSKAEKLNVNRSVEEPYLMGRDVLGMTSRKPGKWMTGFLSEAEERQYRGEFKNAQEAHDWARKELTE